MQIHTQDKSKDFLAAADGKEKNSAPRTKFAKTFFYVDIQQKERLDKAASGCSVLRGT